MSSEKAKRDLIIAEFLKNTTASRNSIAKKLKYAQTTVNSVLNRYIETLSTERKRRSDSRKGFQDPNLARKLERYANQNPSCSVRKLAMKFQISKSWVQKVFHRNKLKAYRTQKAANRNDQQAAKAKSRARKLYEKYLAGQDRCVVMDAETYCVADFKQLPGRSFYRAVRRFDVKSKFKYQRLTKFPRKHMVWQSICSCGQKSEIFISKGTLNKDIYIKECLQKRLLPFLKSHRVSPLFWPGLASVHYAKDTQEWYKANKVIFVPIEANPPNVPQLRPIETFWALVKQKLKEKGREAKDAASFAKYWKSAAKLISEGTVKRLMARHPMKVYRFPRQPFDD